MNRLLSACRRLGRLRALAPAGVLLALTRTLGLAGPTDSLPPHLLVGYWHNFTNAAGTIRLSQVPPAYDVVNVAFADAAADGATMQFTPAAEIYPNFRDFGADMAALKALGKKVLISIGGANGLIQLKTDANVQSFVSSLTSIINIFGFDGVDVDLETSSVMLNPGDTDYRSPTTPIIVNLIKALRQLVANFPNGLLLSMAPETAFVQGGYSTYAGVFGAYLPVIYGVRDILTYVYVQHYNTGSMYGPDGHVYAPGTADFHVAMADALLGGFTVDAFKSKIPFPPLQQRQVLIGLPASPTAASSGFTPPSVLLPALNYLIRGVSFGGSYVLSHPAGYPGFRGLMTWSINWDVYSQLQWSGAYRKYFDTTRVTSVPLAPVSAAASPGSYALGQNYPNPFNPATTLDVRCPVESRIRLVVYDMLGRQVGLLMEGVYPPGTYRVRFDGSNLASGVYFARLSAAPANRAATPEPGFMQSRPMLLSK